MVKAVREKIRRNPQRSARKLASEHNISYTSMRRVLRYDLKLKPYKKKRRHGLTIKNIENRKQKCRVLLKRHAGSNIVFCDEKLFLLQPSLNVQNDRVYAVTLEDIPQNKRAAQRFQNVPKIMVWGAISTEAKFPLVFIKNNIRINAEYYKRNILQQHLLPNAKKIFGNRKWVFQQDGAPAHRAKTVQRYLKEHVPDFIDKDSWPAASPDLNPLDYFVWGYMLSKLKDLNIAKVTNLAKFESILVKIWDEMPMDIVRAACNSFSERLRRVVKENGGRIE